jgi:hypothetical protein
MKKLIPLMFISLILTCSDDSNNSNTIPSENVTPTNLNLEIIIQGVSEDFPNGNGSGEVIFNSTADNTDYFEYRLGNGEVLISDNGYLEYTFSEYGTISKSIYVYAFNENGNNTFTNEIITIYVEDPNLVYSLELDFTDEFPVGHNTGLNYFNDVTVGVVNYNQNNVKLLLASGTSSYTLEGNNLNDFYGISQVAVPTEGTYYSDYVGLGQLIKDDNGTIYSVFHSEQHYTSNQCPGAIPGFYASIGIGISNDNGQSYELSSSPVVENFYSIDNDNGFCDNGLGEPSITYSKDSSEVFLYYVDHQRMGKGVNISMSKYDVNSNHMPDFENPYYLDVNGNFTNELIRSKEIVVGMGNSDAIFPHVTYNSFTDTYIMVYSENNWGEYSSGASNPNMSGIYYRESIDGIIWDKPPVQLITDWSIPYSFDNHSFSWHPNLIYTNENQSEGYLLYSKAETLQEGHKMWAVKFNLVSN